MRAVWIFALISVFPATASAQKDVFRDALIGFHRNLSGDNGNEGPAIAGELDRMTAALNAWDQAADVAAPADDLVRAYETKQIDALLTRLNRRLQSVPSDRRLELFPETALVPDRAAVTPVFSPVLYVDGFRLVLDGRYAEAVASFRAAVARDPLVIGGPGEAHRTLGIAAADAGNDAKAIEELDAAVAAAPGDERSRVALGRALTAAGRTERAEQILLDTIRRLPQSADAHSALADLYDEAGRGRDALREVEAAAALPVLAGKAALYFRLADLEHRHLEYERVIDPLTRRVKLTPNDGRAHTDLGLAYTRIGRTDDALVELVVGSLLGPDDAEGLTAIGQIYFDEEKFADAVNVLTRATRVAPAFAPPRYLLGQSLARLGRASESQAELAEFDKLRAAANDAARAQFEQAQPREAQPAPPPSRPRTDR